MLSTRVKSVLVIIPLSLIMFYLGGIPFQIFIIAVLGIAAWEYWRLFHTMGFTPSLFIILGGVLLFILQRIFFGIKYADILFGIMIFIVAFYSLICYELGDEDAALSFALNLAGIFYLGWVGSYFISIRSLPNGRWWSLTVLPIIWLADMGAYTIGKPWGKHKIMPRLSPKKSWEGFLGAIAFGIAAGALLSLLWHPFLPDLTIWKAMLMGLILSLLTPLGDLTVSLFKRMAHTKDSGNLIPGHGGVLDRIDTWIWAALIGYYLVLVLDRI
ncbi:MAG: phosphatidate cytidylyltransferase [Chloroflexota bacterium]